MVGPAGFRECGKIRKYFEAPRGREGGMSMRMEDSESIRSGDLSKQKNHPLGWCFVW